METVGLEKYIVEIDNITTKKLLKTIEESIKNSQAIKKQLEDRIPKIRKEILQKLNKNMKGL